MSRDPNTDIQFHYLFFIFYFLIYPLCSPLHVQEEGTQLINVNICKGTALTSDRRTQKILSIEYLHYQIILSLFIAFDKDTNNYRPCVAPTPLSSHSNKLILFIEEKFVWNCSTDSVYQCDVIAHYYFITWSSNKFPWFFKY